MKLSLKLKILLAIIIFLAAFLRFYRLDDIPPSLNWDEASAGYNAYTIANWGRDEWNKFLPLVFTSFRDDKHPVHIYSTVPIVKFFGLSVFTARFTGALIGVLSIIVIFYLAKITFQDYLIAFLAALFLAISPYHIHFSRGLWEVNFALFFFLLALLLFYYSLNRKSWLISISYLCFGITILAYHSSKIVVPPLVLLLTIFYFRDLKKLALSFYIGIFIFIIFVLLLFIDLRLAGLARAQQTQFEQNDIEKTYIYQKTKNSALGLGEIFLVQYFAHFTPQYLFLSGDQSPRNSVKTFGEFYSIDALFIFLGFIYLLRIRSKITAIFFFWLLLAPIPASLAKGAPSATRAIFMCGILNLIAAIGLGSMLNYFNKRIRITILLVVFILMIPQIFSYLSYYFNVYPKKDAQEWQYGMEQIVEFVKSHPEYSVIYMTDIRSQPYIFFLFYLKYPLPDFTNTVMYNRSESKSYSTVSSFGNYYFGGWDPIESTPQYGVLYILTPSQYDGLKHRSAFDVKKIVNYPDRGIAFFIVSEN